MPAAKLRVVLDTNVLISAGIRVEGFPYRIVDAVLGGKMDAFHCEATEGEATDVMTRGRFKRYGFPPVWARTYFRLSHRVPTPADGLVPALPDPADTVFLALALQQMAILVTGNIAHYPAEMRAGVEVLTPREFVERFSSIFTVEAEAVDLELFVDEASPTARKRSFGDPPTDCVPPYCSKDGKRLCRRHGGGR